MRQQVSSQGGAGAWPSDPRPWTVLADAAARAAQTHPEPLSRRRVLLSVVAGVCVVIGLVGFAGSGAARRLAEKEAVNDAAQAAGVLADAVVQPALRDRLASGNPRAYAAMDRAVHAHVLGALSVRVKIWTPQGKIVYSDEPALVGRTLPLPAEHQDVFTHPAIRAEVTDLSEEENQFERGEGKLLEVYRPIWTPSGDPLLFETYAPYDFVSARTGQVWRGFAGITLTSLFALLVLMAPLVWRLDTQVRRAQQQREEFLQLAVQASTDERRRIAGNLHDGVIQDLAGASLMVSSAAARAAAADQTDLAVQLRSASLTVRNGISAMRSLVVDIYPPNLESAGLVTAIEGLVISVGARDVAVSMDLDPVAARDLDLARQQLVYRVAHETLLNAMRHADPSHIAISLRSTDDATLLEVSDDGLGFPVDQLRLSPKWGHVGLQVLADVARDAGVDLGVASGPGQGTRWLLRIPRPADAGVPARDQLDKAQVRGVKDAAPGSLLEETSRLRAERTHAARVARRLS